VFEVEARVGKNRLVVRLWGEIDDAEAPRIADAAIAAMDRLRPGFDILSDLSGVTRLHARAAEPLRRIIEVARTRRFRRGVRVVGRSVDAALLFERTSRAIGHEAHLAFSLEEAEQLLDGGWP
jgi:hypothetical protein